MAPKKPPTTPAADPVSVQRGNYNRSLRGPLLMALGRIASIPLQYYLITVHPLSALGIPRPPTSGTIALPFLPAEWAMQPLFPTLILFMTVVLVTKQVLWLSYCSELITVPFACFASLADYFYEGLTALVFTGAAVNPLWRPSFVKVGVAVHLLAALTELAIELQRLAFKADRRNRGRICTSGLWGVCRHPNFALNVVYGTAYGFAAGGPVYACMTGGLYLANFTMNAIGPKEEYMAGKYGVQWEKYVKETKWKMFPGIY